MHVYVLVLSRTDYHLHFFLFSSFFCCAVALSLTVGMMLERVGIGTSGERAEGYEAMR